MKRFTKFAGDKVWVITGAGRGIGRELVRLVSEVHAVVWAIDLDPAALADLRSEAEKKSWDVFTLEADVTSEERMRQIIQDIRKTSKRIDVWINNAGVQRVGAFTAQPKTDFDLVMNVNLTSVINLSRLVTQAMEDQGSGILLNMASTAGHVPAPFMTAYVAAKHGVVGFTKALDAELQLMKSPVRAAFASPGFVDTSIISRGSERGFPEWLSWMLSDAKVCAREILDGLRCGKSAIYPTLSGTMMRAAYAVAPKTTVKSSKMLLSKGALDFVLNRFQVPRS